MAAWLLIDIGFIFIILQLSLASLFVFFANCHSKLKLFTVFVYAVLFHLLRNCIYLILKINFVITAIIYPVLLCINMHHSRFISSHSNLLQTCLLIVLRFAAGFQITMVENHAHYFTRCSIQLRIYIAAVLLCLHFFTCRYV